MEFGNIAANFVGLCFVKIKSMKITKDGFDIEYTGFAYNSLINVSSTKYKCLKIW